MRGRCASGCAGSATGERRDKPAWRRDLRTSYIEGVAIHDDLESCVGAREDAGEALTEGDVGWVIEPRNHRFGVPTPSQWSEGNIAGRVIASCQRTLRGQRACACVESPSARTGRSRGCPVLFASFAGTTRLTKGNTDQHDASRTQSRDVDASSALGRVRRVAQQDRGTRFTALLHHVTLDRLRTAYWALNPRAAAGADGVTWGAYGQDLEANLQDLHGRVYRGAYRARPSRRVYIPKADGRLRYVHPSRWSRPVGAAVDPTVQILEVGLQVLPVGTPRHAVCARSGPWVQRPIGCPQTIQRDVVKQRCEPRFPVLLCNSAHTSQRTGRVNITALSPRRVVLVRVPLGQPPFLHQLRRRLPGLVRQLRRYYAAVRLPTVVHLGLAALAFPERHVSPSQPDGQPRDLPVLALGDSTHAQAL